MLKPAAQGAGGADRGVGQSDELRPAQQVVREGGEDGPGAVGVEMAGGEVRQGLVFEVGDDLLDDGVVAVLGLDGLDRIGPVGEKREMAPVRPQRGLRADQAGAADDQPPAAVDGFGDLRLPALGVVDGLPGVRVDRVDRGSGDRLGHPHADRVLPAGRLESLEDLRVPEARVGPEQLRARAPARSTRAISSSTNRSIPVACSPSPCAGGCAAPPWCPPGSRGSGDSPHFLVYP